MIQRYALVGGIVAYGSKRKLKKADILIEDGVIIGSGNFKKERITYDVSGCLLFPGFINSHSHFGETIFQGLFPFSDLRDYINKTERLNEMTRQHHRFIRSASANMTIMKLLQTGVTTVCAGRCSIECDTTGMRSFSGYMLMQTAKLDNFTINFNREFKIYLKKLGISKLSRPLIFLHSLYYSTPGSLTLAQVAVKKNKIAFTSHVSETAEEEDIIRERFGMSSVKVMDRYKLLNRNSLLVHCCYITKNDIQLIKDCNANVVVCPTSNIRLGNKMPPIKEMIAKGINLSIATDGFATASTSNILKECLALKERMPELEDSKLIDMITINPSAALHLNCGAVCKGKLADICAFYIGRRKLNENKMLSLIYKSRIKHLIINGKFIIKDEKFVTVDTKEIKSKFKRAQSIVERNVLSRVL